MEDVFVKSPKGAWKPGKFDESFRTGGVCFFVVGEVVASSITFESIDSTSHKSEP